MITFAGATPPSICGAQVVKTRAAWADPWVTQPNLHCRRLTLCTGEGISHAEFRWRFGKELITGVTRPVASVLPHSYVRVEIDGADGRNGFVWEGRWTAAVKADVDQTFMAMGLETMLDEPCRSVPWVDDSGTVRWSGAGLQFNAGLLPNRSVSRVNVPSISMPIYVWSSDHNTAKYWSTANAVETLLELAAPKDSTGAALFTWTLSGYLNLPAWDWVDLPTHGRTWLSLLRSLIPRYRLIGFTVEEPTTVRVFTFAESAVTIYDSQGIPLGDIPANSDQETLDNSADATGQSSLATDAHHLADQVIVTGERRKIVCTLSWADDSLDGAWDQIQEPNYEDGGASDPAYPPAAEVYARQEWRRRVRARAELAPVFAWFTTPDAWTQEAGDGFGSAQQPLFLDEDDNPLTVYWSELLLLDRLPLETGYDYSGTKISDLEDEPGHHGDPTSDFHAPLPPLAWVYLGEYPITGNVQDGPWDRADQLGRVADLETPDDTTRRTWSADVRVARADTRTLELRVHGEPQHVLAELEQAAWADEDQVIGATGWREMVVTVCLQESREVEVRWPEEVTPLGDQVRVQRIEARGYELIEVQPGTVVGVAEDGTLVHTDGGLLQDDRQALLVIAQRAYAWSRVPRYWLQLRTHFVDGDVYVGQLITEITDAAGTFPVNTVVTEVTVECPIAANATPPAAAMSFATAFAEMDPFRL